LLTQHKYKKERRLKEFTREKMMEETDPYFSPVEVQHDEDGKEIVSEHEKVKKNYFDSKFEYMKKTLEEK
jgi:hypothetical protein